MAQIDTPQLAFPFTFRGPSVAEVEQDSLNEITMAVEILLRWPEGVRDDLPNFGTPDLALRESTEDLSAEIRRAIALYEPRADILLEERPELFDDLVRNFIVTVGRTNA